MDKYSYLSNGDVAVFEDLYNQYIKSPDSVEHGWKKFFEGFEFARKNYEDSGEIPENFQKEFKVINLIDGYRKRGHLFTKTNPVRERRKYSPTLELENFGLGEEDLNSVFQAGSEVGLGPCKLSDIVEHLQKVYCRSIGVEYMYIRNVEQVSWIQSKIHFNDNYPKLSVEQQKQILHKLNQAVVFESFLHTKFVGQKRFSLEGAESLIPAIDTLIESGAELGVDEFVFGMAHRGRLNVLANIFNKTYKNIFSEFEGKDYRDALFQGDVKYHLGYSSDIKTLGGKNVHLSLSPNPSHLESVGPVMEGICRAKVDLNKKGDYKKLIPVLVHGDASIAGQGVVYEVIQMAQLDGYKTGGTIHIVINNQIGFTTNYLDARSSTYCTDVAKVTLSPVFHVNGDDVEALVHAMKIAVEYRQTFGKDVFIDLLCYRKYGHNEGDEPRFTQPLLYKAITKHPNPREIYIKNLEKSGVIGASLAKEMKKRFSDMLQDRLTESKEIKLANITDFMQDTWKGIRLSKKGDFDQSPNTGVSKGNLMKIAKVLTTLPAGKKFFKKVEKIIGDRAKMIEENKLDWGMCELMAYGTLLQEGHPIRISGQDVERGTFSHRHAILKLEDSEEEYCQLCEMGPENAKFEIYNSLLSEYGVLGFDYGFSMASPNGLTIWEAQFGDFSNGAQIVFDQFICCSEEKWKRAGGLVMLLPHGYEGQGAEHSSGRMERYLQSCGEANLVVANCTTPANFYHLLRRQLKWEFRKPLVVFTPKKLLRYPACVSTLEDLSQGNFQEVIDDTINPENVKTLVFCSGKIYYDLIEKREESEIDDVAIVRLEQLYPLPKKQLDKVLKKYAGHENLLWVQEEPENMGPWMHILRLCRDRKWNVIARPASGTPATGSAQRHKIRHDKIIEQTFSFSEKYKLVKV